ncbi:MAG: FecR domain-containing protein [Sphingobacteriaceae bacterium]|nr:FecR domain-containing protein [Cytophagaceae bacterium]
MKQYESYTTEDFIRDEGFRDWVQGQRDQETFWLSFLRHYPRQRGAFRQAEQFIRAASVAPEALSETEIRRETEKFIESAGLYPPQRQPGGKSMREKIALPTSFFRWGMSLAALLVAVLGLGWYFWPLKPAPSAPPRSAEVPTTRLVETNNATAQALRVLLSDGSEVVLSPRSRLRYPAQFTGNTRVVYLKGEGNFSVTRRNQPFLVYSGETVTKVLGTRFVVRAFDLDRNITVKVLSGKVQVYKTKSDRRPDTKEVNGLILNANQAAVFEKSAGSLTKTLVERPFLLQKFSAETQFAYDEVPLAIIFRELEKSYGIPIQFDEQRFEACKITATLSNESLYEKLDLLCKAASATYEITDGQILVSRVGYK